MKREAIVGIYLAAGGSKRFGENKLSQPVGKYPLGSLALSTAIESKLDKIVIVTQETERPEWLLSTVKSEKWMQVPCKESVKGQAYSIKCGIRSAEKLSAEAIMIMLADQPMVSKEMIDEIISKYKREKAALDPIYFIGAFHSEGYRPPILFAQSMFEDLCKLEGDMGARYLIRNKMNEGHFINFVDPKLFFDVDTKEDYQSLLGKQLTGIDSVK